MRLLIYNLMNILGDRKITVQSMRARCDEEVAVGNNVAFGGSSYLVVEVISKFMV